MVVFLLLLMPLAYWGIQYCFDGDNVRKIDVVLPFIYGFILGIPFILFQWAIDIYFPLNWSVPGVYINTFFSKEGIMLYPMLLILFLVFRKKAYSGIPLRELTGWFAGYYFMLALIESLTIRGAITPHEAVLLPLFRLFIIFLSSTFLVRSFHAYKGYLKTVFTILYFTAPLVLLFIPLADLMNKKLLAYLFLAVMGAVSMVLYYMESRGELD